MKLTLEMLVKLNACNPGIEWFKKQNEIDVVTLINKAIESKDNKTLNFANWGITRLLDRTSKIKYAVFAAEQVVDIFEKRYPGDKRPREAIEAAKKSIESDTEANRSAADAAYTAADAAYTAAYAAADAARAAARAARAAAYTAAYAAYTAAYATYTAADAAYTAADAADAAADAAYTAAETKIKILRYGITLIEEGEQK